MNDVAAEKATQYLQLSTKLVTEKRLYEALLYAVYAAIYGNDDAKQNLHGFLDLTVEQGNEGRKKVVALTFENHVDKAICYKVLQHLRANNMITSEFYIEKLEEVYSANKLDVDFLDSKLAGKIQRQIFLTKAALHSGDTDIKDFLENGKKDLGKNAQKTFQKLETELNDRENRVRFFDQSPFAGAEAVVFMASAACFYVGYKCIEAIDVLGIPFAFACWGVGIALGALAATVGQIAVPFLYKYFSERAKDKVVQQERVKEVNTDLKVVVKAQASKSLKKHEGLSQKMKKNYSDGQHALPNIHFFLPPPKYTASLQQTLPREQVQFGQ